MRYLVILMALILSAPAYAGYDTQGRNIIKDIDTMTVDEATANDYIYVNRVSDTSYGYGTVEKTQLTTLQASVKTLIATNTLTTADCGKTMLLNATTEFATTLPTPTANCKLKFIVKAAPASASYTIVTASSGNVLIGGINELEVDTGDDGPYDTDADTLTIYDGVAAVGDWVEFISDGTSWYLTGQTNLDGGMVLSTAS